MVFVCYPVRLLNRILSVVIMCLWLPATQHCGLQGAGLISVDAGHHEAAACCETGTACPHVACQMLENSPYKTVSNGQKVSAPDFVVCLGFLCARLSAPVFQEKLVAPVGAVESPRDWVPTWQFVRRAAPISRAPSLVV